MQRALTLYSTSIGKKVVMALSGAILAGFTVGHFLGNCNLYLGPEAFNGYAEKLASMPYLLWPVRALLLFSVTAHLVSAIMLMIRNRQARPQRYKVTKDQAQDYAAKTMYLTGPMLFFFIVYHLAHMTFGQTFGVYEWEPNNPYNNLVRGFQQWPVVIPYMLGVISLGLHLFHGIYSAFQSMGLSHPQYDHLRRDLAIGVATLITIGNLMFPIMVQLGKVAPSDAAADLEGFGDSGTINPLQMIQ